MQKELYRLLFHIALGNNKKKEISNYKRINKEILLETAFKHRVRDPILHWDCSLKAMGQTWTERSKSLNEQYTEFKKIHSFLTENGIKFLLLKGIMLERYYPKNVKRTSNDYDIVLKDISSFWELSRYLLENNYEFEYFPLFSGYNEMKVISKFTKRINDVYEVKIEINVGGFMISECTWLTSDDIWDNIEYMLYKDEKIPVPNSELSMVILIIEASGNKHLRIRDLIDYHFIKKASLNYEVFYKIISKYKLEREFSSLKRVYKALLNNNPLPLIKKEKTPNYIQRIKRDIHHTIPILIKRRRLFVLYYYYVKEIGNILLDKEYISVVDFIDKLIPVWKKFKNGMLVNFIFISGSRFSRGKWTEIYYNNYKLVITPIGMFLASNFCILDDSEMENIKGFIKGIK